MRCAIPWACCHRPRKNVQLIRVNNCKYLILIFFTRKSRKSEPAISRVLSTTTIHLGQPSPTASSDLPGSPLGTGGAPKRYSPIWSCSRRGLPCRELLPVARCALTAPFHPYQASPGGIFSVALSMGSHPPGVTWRLVRRSPDFPLQRRALQRLPGRLRLSWTADST